MPARARYYTDPACVWSWGAEPVLRRLLWEFDGELELVWVMGGLARSYGGGYHDSAGGIGGGPDCFADLISHWLDVAAETRMPCDPRIWTESPLASTYPACQAVKAASEQGPEAGYRYLRRLREGIMAGRRKLDHIDALLAEAGPAGLDRDRFEIDLRSNATVEAFAADLEEVREIPAAAREAGAISSTEGRDRLSFPSLRFEGDDGGGRCFWGSRSLDPAELRAAAIAAGAEQVNEGPLGPLDAVAHFGTCATRELEELSGRPRPVVEAEAWGLARDWQLRPSPALTGTLWDAA